MVHWTVAVTVLTNHFWLDGGDDPHLWIGYLAAAAVLARVGVGFLGKGYSRFSHFPLQLQQLKSFLTYYFKRPPQDYVGHNPLASYTYIAIWIFVLMLGLTGWMMGLDAYWGEEWLHDLHNKISNLLLILVGAHILGILMDAIKFRRPTWMAMITGRK